MEDEELKEYVDNSYKDRMCTMLEMLIRMQFPGVNNVIVVPDEEGFFTINVTGDNSVSKEEVQQYLEWMKKEFEVKPKTK